MKGRIEGKKLTVLRGALKCNGYLEWILRDLREENNSESEKEIETLGETMQTSDPIHERIIGTNEASVQKIRHSNIFLTNKHTETIAGEAEGSRG